MPCRQQNFADKLHAYYRLYTTPITPHNSTDLERLAIVLKTDAINTFNHLPQPNLCRDNKHR